MSKRNPSLDVITISWEIDDVIQRAIDYDVFLTRNEAREILSIIEASHDCNYGINWETIDFHIDEYIEELKKNGVII